MVFQHCFKPLLVWLLVNAVTPVSSASASFDLADTNQTLGYAQAAYCAQGLEEWNCGEVCRALPSLVNVTVAEDGKTYGLAYIGFEPASKTIQIAFRGTIATSYQNWWSDLSSLHLVDTPLCPAPGCKVGGGFVDAYSALQDKLRKSVQTILSEHPDASVTVTGHSLGAALVHLCVVDLFSMNIPVKKAITFGSPRTGNIPFANYYNSSRHDGDIRWRVTHYRDPIVHLPGVSPLNWFEHVPTEVFFDRPDGADQHHTVCDGSGEDHSCSYSYLMDPTSKYHLDYMGRTLGSKACPP